MSLLRILHTNDLHGKLTPSVAKQLAEMRAECDLFFDTGDCIKAGNLAFAVRPEPVWPILANLNCTASVPGNRESHLYEFALRMKFAGHQHPILCANLARKNGGAIFPPSTILQIRNLRVAVFGVMVAMVTPKMASQAAATLTWRAPIEVAVEQANRLAKESDLVIALTHIGLRQDQLLAQATSDVQIILGGHSHSVLTTPERVGQTWIAQGGSHARFAGIYDWDGTALSGELRPLVPGA